MSKKPRKKRIALNIEQQSEMFEQMAEGQSQEEAAVDFGISVRTIRNIIQKYREGEAPPTREARNEMYGQIAKELKHKAMFRRNAISIKKIQSGQPAEHEQPATAEQNIVGLSGKPPWPMPGVSPQPIASLARDFANQNLGAGEEGAAVAVAGPSRPSRPSVIVMAPRKTQQPPPPTSDDQQNVNLTLDSDLSRKEASSGTFEPSDEYDDTFSTGSEYEDISEDEGE